MRDLHLPGRSPVYATNGMAATSSPLASKVAIQILEAGGNAVDAAIAAAILQSLTEPAMTSIGGDCFVLLSKPGEEVIALNGSGRAPAGLDAAKLREQRITKLERGSVHSVTIPGAIEAFCRLSADHGKLGLKAALAPSIYYMRAGIPVSDRNAVDWVMGAQHLQGDARKFYLNKGEPFKRGQIFAQPNQAEVLEIIADKGRDGFYDGPVMEDMLRSLQEYGGTHQAADFQNTACEYTQPVSGHYGDFELVEHPPNGQGATAILMTNMMAHFDIASMDPFGSERAHIEAEIAKLAYDARDRFIADQATRMEHMLAPETAEKLAALIDPKRAMDNLGKKADGIHKDTICLSVVDKDRMSVSMIYSCYTKFGSGIASSKYGINFQNRGMGFTLEKGHPNEAGGGKRPLHTIIPGMLRKDGETIAPFGVMGGGYQPNGHARFLSNIQDFGMDPQEAIDAPRSFADADTLKLERGYSEEVIQKLADLGHNVTIPDEPIGGAQTVWIDEENGCLIGASDHRKDGLALGY